MGCDMSNSRHNRSVQAVVFDMDGVLFDSSEMIYRAMEDVLGERDVMGVTREHMAAVTGKPITEMYRLLAPGLDTDELEAAHLAHHDDNLHLLKGFDDTMPTLEYLAEQGYKLGVFTGFNHLTYDRLDQFEIRGHFDHVVETSQYKQHKPHPEGLLLCIDRLGVKPEKTIYIGDGVSDIYAGKSAGVLSSIGITTGFGSRDTLEPAGADYIIDSLAELRGVIEELDRQNGS